MNNASSHSQGAAAESRARLPSRLLARSSLGLLTFTGYPGRWLIELVKKAADATDKVFR